MKCVGRNTRGCKNLCEVTNRHCTKGRQFSKPFELEKLTPPHVSRLTIRCNALRLLHPARLLACSKLFVEYPAALNCSPDIYQ